MTLLRIASILLLLQAILFVHLLMITTDPGLTGHVSAVGGAVTNVELAGTSPWAGIYGRVVDNGSTSVTVIGGDLLELHVTHPVANCSKTEVYASTSTPDLEAITPIDPATADTILGFSPANGVSVSSMFDEQYTYTIAGREVQLWSTTSNSQLSSFRQGIGYANGRLVFVAQTINNGLSYSGETANYQLLLPAGTWNLVTDTTDTCTSVTQIETEETDTELALRSALPERICVDEQSAAYATYTFERTYCSASDVGEPGCRPAEDVQATIRYGSTTLTSTTTDETGAIPFTATQEGTHTITLRDENQTSQRSFSAQYCEAYTTGDTSSREIIGDTVDVEAANIQFSEVPEQQEPIDMSVIARTEVAIIAWLSAAIILLMGLAYYQAEKDSVALLLKARIWLMEKLR